jgi:methoxymalonate biosynthesis protein
VTGLSALLAELVGDRAAEWDRHGALPPDVLHRLGTAGVLCAQVPREYGGPGATSRANGELTAQAGALCGSIRSVMTAHGMAAWLIARHGNKQTRSSILHRLTGGELAGVALSEPQAGSDLSAIRTEIRADDGEVVVSGRKVWVTGAAYADLLLVFGRRDDGAGAVAVVPVTAPGVQITRVPDPVGCRAAGHGDVELTEVRLPGDAVIGAGTPITWLVSSALAYGRLSVAWGCAGILRSCREAAVSHARSREQFGTPLARHQLVARHLADLWAAEQAATRVCEHASHGWDTGSTRLASDIVLAKYVSAELAARGAARAVQVLGSAGAREGHAVARAYRDAKIMEIIEGSTEISQLLLADHALAMTS